MILLVGEMPGHEPGQPLAGLNGAKLAKLAGTTLDDFIRRTERRNLFGQSCKWDARKAAQAANELMYECSGFEAVVLCGRRVATAFGLGHLPVLRSAWIFRGGDGVGVGVYNPEFLVFPHPSGRNRWWNNEEHRLGAFRVMQRIWQTYA